MPNKPRSAYGPLQIVHDFKFTALNVKDDYSFISALPYEEKAEYMKKRIDRLYSLGYGGVVMNVDYEGYLRSPEAFGLFSECAHHAKKHGMRVWIYDEQYYPSGSAGGETLIDHPELEALGLACVTRDVTVESNASAIRIPSPNGHSELKFAVAAPITDSVVKHGQRIDISGRKDLGGGLCANVPQGEWRVWCFFLRPLYEHTGFCSGTRASRRFINVFNKKAVERFFEVTFEKGYNLYARDAVANIVDAVFTDEPYSPFYAKTSEENTEQRTVFPSHSVYDKPDITVADIPFIPWDVTVPDRYRERYGRDITLSLPDLFEKAPHYEQARIDFYTLLSDMGCEAFPEQVAARLEENGIRLSGHYFGEEAFDYHPTLFGDILDHLGVMGIPGCDCLWSDIDMLRYSIACKLASSAAHRRMRDEVMIEASNMVDSDQNITLNKAKAAISAMMIHGVTLITSYYSEHLFTDEEMRELTRHISSLAELFRGGKYKVNTLLYYPFENLCAMREPLGVTEENIPFKDSIGIASAATELMKHQVCFDLVNKRALLECKIGDGHLLTPWGEKIKYLVFPNISLMDDEIIAFVQKAHVAGVEIRFDGEGASDGKGYARPTLSADGYPHSEITLSEHDQYITFMHRAFDGYDLFMLMNTDTTEHSVCLKIPHHGSSLTVIDPGSKVEKPLSFITDGDEARISLNIPELDTVIIARHK